MITIDDIKDQYILPTLAETGYSFNIVTDTGAFQEAIRTRNTVINYVNGLLRLTGVDFQRLNDGRLAAAFEMTIEFIIPIGDRVTIETYQGSNNISLSCKEVQDFRAALSNVLSNATKITLTRYEDDVEKIYTGGVFFNLPVAGQRAVRDLLGDSINYSCSITVAVLEDAVNTTELTLKIDGETIGFTGIKLSRNPALLADVMKESNAGEASVYSESTQFKIDFTIPVLKNVAYSSAVMRYIIGLDNGNIAHSVYLAVPELMPGEGILSRTSQMLFGGCETQGNGVSNLLYTVSLVPYTETEALGG